MAEISTSPTGEIIEIKRAHIDSLKADFVKREVKITLSISLDEELLALRDRLAFLAWDDSSQVKVTIEPLQARLL